MSLKTSFREVDRWIDSHSKDLVDLTCRLVSIDTTVPPGRNYPKISHLLSNELKEAGAKASVSNVSEAVIRRKVDPEVGLKGPRPNTYGIFNPDGQGPKILLNGHVDVVPAQSEGWTNDPFDPTVRKNMIYGRGTADMKGDNACTIMSIRALNETGMKFNGSILSTFTTDEEVGGYTGVNHLIDHHVITKNVDYCLSTDAGIEALHVASLGDAEFLLTVHGKPAHSGRGWTGTNAIEYGALLISELNKLGHEVGLRRSKVDAEPIYGIKKMRPGVYCTVAKGGLKGNIIPDSFEVLVDRRSIPEEKPAQIQNEIAQVVKSFQSKYPEVKVSMRKILGYAPMMTRPDHPFVKTVRRIARTVLGVDVRPSGSQGSTDMAAVSELGIPVVVLGASRNDSNVHGIDEHVRIQDLVNITKVMAHSYLELDHMGPRQ